MLVEWRERTLQRWARKINYPLDKQRLGNIRTTAKRVYLKQFVDKLPGYLKEIQAMEFGFSLGESDSITHFEGTGLLSKMEELLGNLPEIDLPEDPQVRRDLIRILELNREMYADEMRRLKAEREEYLRQVEERLDRLGVELTTAFNHQQNFLRRVNPTQRTNSGD